MTEGDLRFGQVFRAVYSGHHDQRFMLLCPAPPEVAFTAADGGWLVMALDDGYDNMIGRRWEVVSWLTDPSRYECLTDA